MRNQKKNRRTRFALVFILCLTAEIGESAFEGIAATAVEIPAGCGTVGKYAFRNCGQLERIRVPAGCVLGEDAFEGCGKVYIFSGPGSEARAYCLTHGNCVFIEEGQN